MLEFKWKFNVKRLCAPIWQHLLIPHCTLMLATSGNAICCATSFQFITRRWKGSTCQFFNNCAISQSFHCLALHSAHTHTHTPTHIQQSGYGLHPSTIKCNLRANKKENPQPETKSKSWQAQSDRSAHAGQARKDTGGGGGGVEGEREKGKGKGPAWVWFCWHSWLDSLLGVWLVGNEDETIIQGEAI